MNLFSYGSLMFPEVLEALTQRRFASEDMIIGDFERRALSGRPYPGLRVRPGSSVDGRLWFDLDPESMRILDSFEDSCYQRRTISVSTRTRGAVEAEIYVVPPSAENGFVELDWDKVKFETEHLAEYVAMCRRFRKEELQL